MITFFLPFHNDLIVESVDQPSSEVSRLADDGRGLERNKHHIESHCLGLLPGLRGSVDADDLARIVEQLDESTALDLFVVEEVLLPEQSAHRYVVLPTVILEAVALLGREKQPTAEEQFEHRVVAMNIITNYHHFSTLRRRSTIMPNLESG